MRILIKGGVWKNTEDEILKAAVMKYGKNQWSRVASLMNRKSAKQCKARWYEWLDPSIKKTEWARDEEEKLLHLAKLMPNQWRTIAPIVGRTAAQCMEHYEKLLDMAQNEGVTSSSSGSTGTDINDPRRLRPGEIDPTPETKPARPDPIDMDEDEKEMLSEARARLANTMGKKAKRKARERQLEESRTLTILQKKRELKAAGLDHKLGGSNKKRRVNHSTEIMFQKVPPVGFHDVGEENVLSSQMAKSIDPRTRGMDIAMLEGRHAKEEESRQKEQDKHRLKKLFEANAPLAVMRAAEQADSAGAARKKTSLSLPAPQVSEVELDDIVRISQQNANMLANVGGGEGSSQALIGDYNELYGRSALPTARTPATEDVLMQEARNQHVLRQMTPLVITDAEEGLPELHEGTGFEGMAPRQASQPTPNVIFSSGRGVQGSVDGCTPMSTMSGMSTSTGVSSIRDQFGLNNQAHGVSTLSLASTSHDGSSAAERGSYSIEQKLNMLNQLNSLPEPEYSYEVKIPQVEPAVKTKAKYVLEDVDEDETGADTVESFNDEIEDMGDIEERARVKKQQQAANLFESRSTVIQRNETKPGGYLRPPGVSHLLLSRDVADTGIERMIHEEMCNLIGYDTLLFPPVDGSTKKVAHQSNLSSEQQQHLQIVAHKMESGADKTGSSIGTPYPGHVGKEYINMAKQLLSEEMQCINPSPEQCELLNQHWEEIYKSSIYIPSAHNGRGGFVRPNNKSDIISGYRAQLESLQCKIDKDLKKIKKMEQKCEISTRGYALRLSTVSKIDKNDIKTVLNHSVVESLNQSSIELDYFQCLKNKESSVYIPKRLGEAKRLSEAAEDIEAKLQAKYASAQNIQTSG